MHRVAVYGAANVDIHALCFQKYVSADSNPGSSYISLGGVGRNIAENCVRLGLQVELVTVIGDDELSSIVVNDCAKHGIGLEYSFFAKNTATPRYICIMDNDGTLAGAVAAMEAFDKFDAAEFEKRTGPGDKADIIVIDANLPEKVIAAACERWKTKTLFFDPVSVAKAEKGKISIGAFSMVKPNLREALVLAGLEQEAAFTGPVHGAAKNCAEILRLRGAGEVFISLGPEGLFYSSASGCGIARPLDTPVVNVSGAGDAAGAGIVWAHLANCGTMDKARYAVAAASLCAGSAETVSKKMSQSRLEELAKEVRHEYIS